MFNSFVLFSGQHCTNPKLCVLLFMVFFFQQRLRSSWELGTHKRVTYSIGDHPFRTSAFLGDGGGGRVKNWPNLTTYSSKKLPTDGGRGEDCENLPTS